MNSQLENISKVWPTIKTIFSVPHTESEYQVLVNILDNLIDEVGNNESHELVSVMETIGHLIENYEHQKYKIRQASPIETLKYLMQEQGLKKSDLKELGNQDIVSEILTGKRMLDLEQIKKISHRFHVSPLVFI